MLFFFLRSSYDGMKRKRERAKAKKENTTSRFVVKHAHPKDLQGEEFVGSVVLIMEFSCAKSSQKHRTGLQAGLPNFLQFSILI